MKNTAGVRLDGFQILGVRLPPRLEWSWSLPKEGMDAFERFAGGDVDAFEIVFRQYQNEVYGWIVRMIRNPAAAEDLTVETFWRIYRYRERYDVRRPFGPWARRIATRVAIDYLKSPNSSFASLTEPVVTTAEERDPVERGELRMSIEKAFRSLPASLRASATLALIEEQPYQEIADALEISVSAVKMRISRAVRQLRASLEKMGIRP